MKKALYIGIIILSISGILIEVLATTFMDPISLGRGIGLIRYYTIQSNVIIFVYFTLGLFDSIKRKELYKKFLPGVVIYITITFVIFAIMLQGTFEITGIRILGNLLVHYIVPILSIIYLFVYNEYSYKMKDIPLWMIYPLCYVGFMLIYGTITSDYLYPFFDLNEISILTLIITIIILIVFFVLLSFITVKIVSKREKTKNK